MEVTCLFRSRAASKARRAIRSISARVVNEGVVPAFGRSRPFAALGLGEIDAAGQFANAQNIEPPLNDIGTQRAIRGQFGEQNRRAEIAEQPEMLPQG